jgi:hypothetical protein
MTYRAPLSPSQMCEKLWTLPTCHPLSATVKAVRVIEKLRMLRLIRGADHPRDSCRYDDSHCRDRPEIFRLFIGR